MSLTLNIVDHQWFPATSFADHANLSMNLGSGPGRAVLAFAIMDRDSATSEPQTCRVGSSSGAGGTLMSAGALNALTGGTTHNSSRLFTLVDPVDTGAGVEVWMAMGDGNAKPGLRVLVVQSSDGRALTVGDLATPAGFQVGSGAVTQAAGSPSAEAIGIVFVRNNGATVATASAGSSLLVPGVTDANAITVDVIQKPGTGAALDVGWVPGDNFQFQARHVLSLTAAAAGATAGAAITGSPGTLAAGAYVQPVAGAAITGSPGTLAAGASVLPTIVSGVLKLNNTTVLANTALDYVAVYDATTGELVTRQTGLSTDAAGRFRISHASFVLTPDAYRVDWQTVTGKRRMPLATAV